MMVSGTSIPSLGNTGVYCSAIIQTYRFCLGKRDISKYLQS